MQRLVRRLARATLRGAYRIGFKAHTSRFMRSDQELWLDLGAGDKGGTDGWLTVDLGIRSDITWDLRRGIPFPDASVSRIYSSHLLEHLSFWEIQRLLDECLRVLETGGSFSVCVPNARIYIEAYVNKGSLDSKTYLSYGPAFNATTRIDVVNYIAYMDGQHKYMWDQDNLLHILTAKGFRDVRIRDFDPSLDLPERKAVSIYAEAIK